MPLASMTPRPWISSPTMVGAMKGGTVSMCVVSKRSMGRDESDSASRLSRPTTPPTFCRVTVAPIFCKRVARSSTTPASDPVTEGMVHSSRVRSTTSCIGYS